MIDIPITTRLRPRTLLIGSLLGAQIGVGMILIWSSSITVLWVGTIVTGLSMASLFPSTITFAGRRLNISGRITGWFFIGVGAGSMFFPWMIGQFFERVGPSTMMVIILSGLIAALILLLTLIQYFKPNITSMNS